MITQDWLEPFTAPPGARGMEDLGFGSFFLLMGISALSALFVSFLYRLFFRSRATGSEIHRAFPLIGLSVTAIFICIQFSLPLSLGLLGALSIVRFRTPIKEPEEIGFLMLVVATSLCCATFNILFLGIILLVAVLTLSLFHLPRGVLGSRRTDGMLILTLPTADYRERGQDVLAALEENLPKGQLDAVSEGEGETVVSYSFPALDRNRLAGLDARWRQLSDAVRVDIYFTRGAAG